MPDSPPPNRTIPPRRRLLPLLLLVPLLAGPAGAGDEIPPDVPRVRCADAPRDGVETWRLEELWRAGGVDDEVFFGLVTMVRSDREGNVLVLDSQLSTVHVYAPDGRYLGARFREGEGPGEMHSARDIVPLPDGRLGALQEFPGRLVYLDGRGNPAGSFMIGDDEPGRGGFWEAYTVHPGDGGLVMSGVYSVPGDDPSLRIRVNYLSLLDDEGGELVRYCEYRNRFDFEDFLFDEKEHMPGFWYNVATAPDGRVFTAPRSDRYLIHVHRPDGALERVVERDYPRWRRTAGEKQRYHRMIEEVFHDVPFPVRIGVEDCDPDILGLQRGLRFREDGNLWVLSSRGVREQPEGVLATWDVLSPAGEFLRQVALACPGDGRSDGVFFAGMDRVIVVHGYVDAVAAQYGRGTRLSDGEDGKADDMQVVCYRVAGRDVTRGS